MQLVSQGGFDGLASIAESLFGHELIHTFEEFGVYREGDLGLWHRSMMFHHTIRVRDRLRARTHNLPDENGFESDRPVV